MNKTNPDEEQLAEYVDDVKVEPAVTDGEADEEPWTGRSSKVALAPGARIYRDFEHVTGGSECVDCKRRGRSDRTHQFHARASKVDGVWRGPEGPHLRTLQAMGYLSGSAEAARRLEEEREIAWIRGVAAESKCRGCRAVIGRDEAGQLLKICPSCEARNGMPELAPWSLAQEKRAWRGVTKESAQASEQELRRGDIEKLTGALSDLVKAAVQK